MHPRYLLKSTLAIHAGFGWGAALLYLAQELVNGLCFFDCLHVIVLNRDALKPPQDARGPVCESRVASREDLQLLAADPRWAIDATKMSYFEAGDTCLLSCVDGQPAGYTWVHTSGRPEIIPGLRLELPQDYLYNYAALTLPEFRGAGLQSHRHHAVLGQIEWQDRVGLIGYVRATNFSSQRGQSKSGYRKIGRIWLWGRRRRFLAIFSRPLTQMGIKRAGSGHPEIPVAVDDPGSIDHLPGMGATN